tara:strand:+ start:1208 stop:1420 length:213 start_codon:yes stop_codon:yes gene_type:complete
MQEARQRNPYNSKKLSEFDQRATLVGEICEWSFKLYDLSILEKLRDELRAKVINNRKAYGARQRANANDL